MGYTTVPVLARPHPLLLPHAAPPSPEKNIEKVHERQIQPDQQVHTGSERDLQVLLERERG
jgi:hypothetical protein